MTGAVLGAIVGHQSGDGADGAEGAAIGAVVGGAIGHSVGDEQDRHYAEQQYYNTELEIARAKQAKAEADTRRQRLVVAGSQTKDAEILSAKQRAESAEAEINNIQGT